jgi:hypothetical protein
MAQNASDSQKVDFLWKKIVYGAAKTDISGNIDATNEPNPSPLQIRADKILQDSASIPGVIPASNSSVVTVYPTTFPVECISTAAIPTPTLTWQTGRTFWVPPEFGSTYQIKVYIAPSGQAANVLTKGTQVFATGSGNNDLWVFDYQAGILNFNSNNTPYNVSNQPISFTGNSVYISGGVYNGAFGLPAAVSTGNITFSNTTISTAFTDANIYFSPTGTGTVQFTGNAAIGLPYGTDATRPTNPIVGFTRYNSARYSIEYYDGTQWLAPGEAVISSQTINPDGSANTFALSSNTSTAGVLVSINGTLQQPTSAYVVVSNNQIQFTEIPLTSDTIEVRYISVGAVTVGGLQFQNSTFVTLDAANVTVTGNILPSADATYSLGSGSLSWNNLYVDNAVVNTNPIVVIPTNGIITNVDVYSTSVYRTAKYIIQANTSSTFESVECLVTHNGTTAYRTVYGVIASGASLGNISVTLTSGNVLVQYISNTNDTNIRLSKQYLVI